MDKGKTIYKCTWKEGREAVCGLVEELCLDQAAIFRGKVS